MERRRAKANPSPPNPNPKPKFHKVITLSDSDGEADDNEATGHSSVADFDKMFANIGHKLSHQKIKTKKRKEVRKNLELPSDAPPKPVPAKLVSKERAEEMERFAREEQELDDLLQSCNKLLPWKKPPLPTTLPTPARKIKKTKDPAPVNPLPPEVVDIDCPSPTVPNSPIPAMPFYVRVNYKFQMISFKLCETDYCYEIRRILAEKVGLQPSDLVIGYDDDPAKPFQDQLTLKQASIAPGVLLEAFKLSPTEKPHSKVRDPLLIRIKVQSSHHRSKTVYEMRKTDQFTKLAQLFAAKNNVNPSLVKFKFDGELVDEHDTPGDLDLDGDELFDVFVSDGK